MINEEATSSRVPWLLSPSEEGTRSSSSSVVLVSSVPPKGSSASNAAAAGPLPAGEGLGVGLGGLEHGRMGKKRSEWGKKGEPQPRGLGTAWQGNNPGEQPRGPNRSCCSPRAPARPGDAFGELVKAARW